jgi:hypothetical protein
MPRSELPKPDEINFHKWFSLPMIPSRQQDMHPMPLAITACRRVWVERDNLLRLGIAPLLLTFLLNVWRPTAYRDLLDAAQHGQTPDPAMIEALWTTVIMGLASWFLTIVFAVNWMRLMMLGPDTVRGLGLSISGRHIRLTTVILLMQMVLGAGMGLVLVVVAMILPFSSLLFLVAVALLVLYSVIMLRLVPVWIGVAIDAPMSFRQAWTRTAGYGLRLLAAILLIFCGTLAIQVLWTALCATLGLLQAAPLATLFVSLVIQFGMLACFSTVFILAYPRFVSETV